MEVQQDPWGLGGAGQHQALEGGLQDNLAVDSGVGSSLSGAPSRPPPEGLA